MKVQRNKTRPNTCILTLNKNDCAQCCGNGYRTVSAYLKNVWCSMQTFHKRLEARWLGSLKPMVLSNCSYWECRGVLACEGEEVGGVKGKQSCNVLLDRRFDEV